MKAALLATPVGIRFGLCGEKPRKPAATLFMFAAGIEETLGDANFSGVGERLLGDGFLCVSLDLPCHGKNTRSDDAGSGLAGWPRRLESNLALIEEFTAQASAVLDFLIAEQCTRPEKTAVFGVSRGGFMGFHFAAADRRVACAAGLCPVTDLMSLSEFAMIKDDRMAKSAALIHHAEKLSGRPIWIAIGNADRRVDTDKAVAFARKVAQSGSDSTGKADVELHVLPAENHSQPVNSHGNAADWIRSKVGGGQ